jgi:hypothetical protein
MINQKGQERKVKLYIMFVYNALTFPTKTIGKLVSVYSMQLADLQNIHLFQ